jgi:hypothetical protein
MFVGIDGNLDAVAEAELGEGARNVAFDGGFAEIKLGSDLGVRQALGNQADDADFAVAEAPNRSGRKGAGSRTAAEVLDQLAVTAGASRVSPADTARTASASCSRWRP